MGHCTRRVNPEVRPASGAAIVRSHTYTLRAVRHVSWVCVPAIPTPIRRAGPSLALGLAASSPASPATANTASAGAPWRIYIKTNDQPVLSDTTGTTTSFDIPTEFKGDNLATMEARRRTPTAPTRTRDLDPVPGVRAQLHLRLRSGHDHPQHRVPRNPQRGRTRTLTFRPRR
jgi:hypothetical protein